MSTSLVQKERFIPSRLSNLAAWLDAKDSNTVVVNPTSGYVSSWLDKSGNNNPFSPDVLPPSQTTSQIPNPTVLSLEWSTLPYTKSRPVLIAIAPDGFIYGYSGEGLFFRIGQGGGAPQLYINIPPETVVVGLTILKSTGTLYTVGNSTISYISGQNPPIFSTYYPLPSDGNYMGLSSMNGFLYTVDIANGRLFRIRPGFGFIIVIWTAPSLFTLTGFVACTPGYIYVGFNKTGESGVFLTRITDTGQEEVNFSSSLFGYQRFTLQNPFGLVATSDNTVYITDNVSPGILVTLRIPINDAGEIISVNSNWLTPPFFNGGLNISPLVVGTDGNLYIPYQQTNDDVFKIAKIQPYQLVTVTNSYYGPVYNNTPPRPGLYFTRGGGLKSQYVSGLTKSKTLMIVYDCPTTSNSMNVQVGGDNLSGAAFGLAQISGVAYTPFQYAIGDLISTPKQSTGINYAFASFDTSTTIITGMVGFDVEKLQASAFINDLTSTFFKIGNPVNTLYTASGFLVHEFIATSNAISPSDRQEVEGYLASKWGLTLPPTHPYYNFQPSGEQWVSSTLPFSISGLTSWLDMTLPIQSQATIYDTASNPTLYNIEGGGLPSLSNIQGYTALPFFHFGLNGYLSRPISPPPSGSILFVYTQNSLPNARDAIIGWGSRQAGGAPPYGPLLVYASANGKLFPTNGGTEFTPTEYPIPAVTVGVPTLVFFAWDTSNFYLSLNGGNPFVISGAVVEPWTGTSLYIGNDDGRRPDMTVGEVLVYNQYLEQSERQILEGYLSWKWNIVTTLSGSHPFKLQAPINETFTQQFPLDIPSQFESLTTWLDAADTSTIEFAETNTKTVKYWYDKSSSSDTFVYYSTYNSHVRYLNTAIQNGPILPGVFFSSNGAMSGSVVSPFLNKRAFSCFLVVTVTNGGMFQVMTGGLSYSVGDVTDGNSFGFFSSSQSGIAQVPTQGFNNTNINRISISGSNRLALFGRMNLSNSIDGITKGDGSVNFNTPVNNGYDGLEPWFPKNVLPTPWVLGYTQAMGSIPQSFFLHEFIFLSEYVTDTKRQVLEGYLAWKWGLQSNLPPDHPYKTGRPQSM